MLVENIAFADMLEGFRGKRVFITGHTGFKGSWLCLLLQNVGAEIKGYALAPDHENSLYENLESKLKIESVIADIRESEKVKSEIEIFQPDFIFHMAAQPLVRYSYLHPVETFNVNVMGTVYVLEAVRLMEKLCTTVVVTTDKVYENNEMGHPFGEEDALGGYDPYSSSKAAAEIVSQSYLRSFGATTGLQALATARAGNVIGGGDRSADRIMPDLIRSIASATTLELRNPDAVRPWQHVLDPLAGYLRLAVMLNSDAEKFSGSYNFGPHSNDQLSVKEITELAIACLGRGKYKINQDTHQPHEAQQLRLNITKAISKLKWQPQWDAKTSVSKTVEWFKNVDEKGESAYNMCMEDVKSFLRKE